MKRILPSILFFFCFLLYVPGAQAAPQVAFFTVSVPPTQFKAIRIKRLPKDAYIGLEVESSREVTIAFVNTADYLNLPNPKKPLMVGKVGKRLNFSVTIPASGDYFVVLVNNSETSEADVELKVQAARSAPDQTEGADRILQKFEQQMHKLFVFESFSTGVKSCGRKLAFYGTEGFYLCEEYVRLIYAKVQDRQMAINVLGFSIFHELGLELMQQWDIGGRSVRHSADEFAAVLMVMLQQENNLRQLGVYFVENPSVANAFKYELIDRWHPLSVERAQKILGWLDDPGLVRSWQEKLVPHMQTDLLLRLQQIPTDWTNTDLVQKELAKRRKQSVSPAEKKKESNVREF
jgi:hypothetical protein